MQYKKIIKYGSYTIISISVILLLSIFALNTWLNNKLDKENVTLNNFKPYILDMINSQIESYSLNVSGIELTKTPNDEIFLYLKDIELTDEDRYLQIKAPSLVIENNILTYALGAISDFFRDNAITTNISITRPSIKLNLQQEFSNNLKDASIGTDESAGISSLENLNYQQESDYQIVQEHFYQDYLIPVYGFMSDEDQSYFKNFIHTFASLKLMDASIEVITPNNNYKLEGWEAVFSKESSKKSIQINTPTVISNNDWGVELNLTSTAEKPFVNLDINFKNINPQNLNERLVFLDDIKGFDGSLSGRLNTDINNLGRLESLSLDLNVGESILSHKIDYLDNTHLYDAYLSIGYSSFDEAVKVNEFNAKVDDYSLYAKGDLELNYDTSGRVSLVNGILGEINVQKNKSQYLNDAVLILKYEPLNKTFAINKLDGLLQSGSFSISRLSGEQSINNYEINIDESDVRTLKEFWPNNLLSPIRNWFFDNVLSGKITNANMIFELSEKGKAEGPNLNLIFNESNFKYFEEHPAISNAKGQISYDQNGIEVELETGFMLFDEEKKINLDSFSGFINMSSNPKMADFDINMDCLLIDCLEYFSMIGGEDYSFKDFNERVSGKSSINAKVQFPLSEDQSDQLIINALMKIEDFGYKLNETETIIAPLAEVIISDNIISSKGEFNYSGIQSQFHIETNLEDSRLETKILIKAQPSPTELSIIQPNSGKYITGLGRMPTEIQIITSAKNILSPSDISIRTNLSDVRIEYPFLNAAKNTGDRAELLMNIDRPKEDGTNNIKLTYNSDDIILEGYINRQFNPENNNWDIRGFEILNYSSLKSSNIQLNGYFDNNQELVMDLDASKINITELIDNKIFKRTTDNQQLNQLPNMRLNINLIENLIGKNNSTIKAFKGYLIIRDGKLYQMDVDGLFPNELEKNIKIKYTIEKENLPADLGISTNDGGSFLNFIGLYRNAINGEMGIRAQGPNINNMTGKIQINNIDVFDDKTLVRLFAQSGPDPRFEDLNNVKFKYMEADYRLLEEVLFVDYAKLIGPDVLLTIDKGATNNATGKMLFPGVYCPEYELNASFGTIPLFGQILSGGDDGCLLATPFAITRKSYGEPLLLQTNITGTFAPGILRNAFEYPSVE